MLVYLQKLKTSGGDHLTGNLAPEELVYWLSNTYLDRKQAMKQAKAGDGASVSWCFCSYLAIPKSDTFTTRASLTRQFLAAFRATSNTRETLRGSVGGDEEDASYQISVDEAVELQVLHALADVQADAQQGAQVEGAPPLPEEVEQAAELHELGDDVNGLVLGADAVELHQLRVRQPPGGKQ